MTKRVTRLILRLGARKQHLNPQILPGNCKVYVASAEHVTSRRHIVGRNKTSALVIHLAGMGRVVLTASLLLAPMLFSYGQPEQEQKEFRLTAEADLVLLDVSVKEAKGGYVSNLTKDNFQIYEDGKLQNITQFSSEETPITVGLVVDDSRSMHHKVREVNTAAVAFVDVSNPQDEIFVTHFNDRVRHGLPAGTMFSDNPETLREALWNNKPEGMTSLYDAILDALHQLDMGKQTKKSLLIISDGGDNASKHNFKDVAGAVDATRAILYTIALFDPDDPDHNTHLLKRLSNISGGISYAPKELNVLEDVCRDIAKDMRNRYSIGYVPVRTNNKSETRSIRVAITGAGDGKLIVHARTSYRLPGRP